MSLLHEMGKRAVHHKQNGVWRLTHLATQVTSLVAWPYFTDITLRLHLLCLQQYPCQPAKLSSGPSNFNLHGTLEMAPKCASGYQLNCWGG
jgi:hypothetical protein